MLRQRPVQPIRLLQMAAFVATIDRFAMPPILVAISRDLDVPLADVVRAAGVYFLVYGLCQPLWGAVSDRLGRVRTMQLALALAGLSTLASAFSGSIAVLAVTRGVAGGLFGAAYPSSIVYLGETVPAASRQRDIARLMVGVASGTALAAIGAGALAEWTSWRMAFVVTGVAAVASAIALRALPEPMHGHRPVSVLQPLGEIGRSPMVWLVLAFAFVEGAVLLGALTLLPPAVEHTGATAAVSGAVTGLYGLAVYAGSHLVGRLSQHWHPARLIGLGAVAAAGGCGVLGISQRASAAAVAALLLGIAWTAMHSSLQTWATDVVPPRSRATLVSLFATALFVGSAVAAAATAGLADRGDYAAAFLSFALLAVPLGVGAASARTRWEHPAEQA